MTLANAEQAAAWDGPGGEHWAEHADRYERTTRRHRERLLGTDPVAAGDAVLDVGCGSGGLSRAAARLAAPGPVLGVDLSARQLAVGAARAAAEGLPNVTFEQADAQVHSFGAERFDVVLSSFGVMFFADPAAAFGNLARSLRPGGRLAALAWAAPERNEWVTAVRTALAAGRTLPAPAPGAPGAFSLADPDTVRALLTGAGFTGVELAAVREPTDWGEDAEDAVGFLGGTAPVLGLTQDLDPDARLRALDELRAMLAAHRTPAGVQLGSAAWLITATRP